MTVRLFCEARHWRRCAVLWSADDIYFGSPPSAQRRTPMKLMPEWSSAHDATQSSHKLNLHKYLFGFSPKTWGMSLDTDGGSYDPKSVSPVFGCTKIHRVAHGVKSLDTCESTCNNKYSSIFTHSYVLISIRGCCYVSCVTSAR